MSLIAAAIGAAGAIGGQIFGAKADRKADKRYNEQQIALQNLTNQQNIDFWNMQNRYNTPENQVQRYRAAGLNPNLIYGQGTPGNATPIPAASRPDNRVTSQGDRISQALGSVNDHINTIQGVKQIELLDANIRRTESETQKIGLENKYLSETMGTRKSATEWDEANKVSLWKINQTRMAIEQVKFEVAHGSKEAAIQAANLAVEKMQKELEGQALLNGLREIELQLNKIGIQKGDNIGWRLLGRLMNELNIKY